MIIGTFIRIQFFEKVNLSWSNFSKIFLSVFFFFLYRVFFVMLVWLYQLALLKGRLTWVRNKVAEMTE